jgi:hypothetical protein
MADKHTVTGTAEVINNYLNLLYIFK